MIFETHAHYEDKRFDEDREELFASMAGHGITKIVNVASTLKTTKESIRFAENYDFIYASSDVYCNPLSIRNKTFRSFKNHALRRFVLFGICHEKNL